MIGFLLRAVIAGFGLWLSAQIIPGVVFTKVESLMAAAVLLGVVNAVVRPIVFFLTLPLTVLTLGLFLLVVNAAMIGLVAMLLGGFQVNGLVPGILCAIVTGITGWIGSAFIGQHGRFQRYERYER